MNKVHSLNSRSCVKVGHLYTHLKPRIPSFNQSWIRRYLSSCQFSVGGTAKSLSLELLCLSPGKSLIDAAKRRSKARVKSAEKAFEEERKKRRRKPRYEKASKQKKTSSNEGGL